MQWQQGPEVNMNYLMQLQKLLIGQFLQRQCQFHSWIGQTSISQRIPFTKWCHSSRLKTAIESMDNSCSLKRYAYHKEHLPSQNAQTPSQASQWIVIWPCHHVDSDVSSKTHTHRCKLIQATALMIGATTWGNWRICTSNLSLSQKSSQKLHKSLKNFH